MSSNSRTVKVAAIQEDHPRGIQQRRNVIRFSEACAPAYPW